MQDVTISFIDGPLRGRSYEFEVGRVLIGRLPGKAGLELKGADTSVSRVHVELLEHGGGIKLRNMSPNGTKVDGKIILESVEIRPGARIDVGANHPFTIDWTSFQAYSDADKTVQTKVAPASQGPLSSPIVRAVIGVYVIGMLVVGLWLGISDDGELAAADEWPALLIEYEYYRANEMPEDMRSARVAQAELLVRKLRVLRTQDIYRGQERICRQIMTIDRDSKSPFYRYGAMCLGSL
jgi:hypothetical protein